MKRPHVAAVLLGAALAAACGDARVDNPTGPDTSHPRTRRQTFGSTLRPGSGIGHAIEIQNPGTLVAHLMWDRPDVRLSLYLCRQGDQGGCGPVVAVGATSSSTTQELIVAVEAGRYLLNVDSPIGAAAPASYTVDVSYPLL